LNLQILDNRYLKIIWTDIKQDIGEQKQDIEPAKQDIEPSEQTLDVPGGIDNLNNYRILIIKKQEDSNLYRLEMNCNNPPVKGQGAASDHARGRCKGWRIPAHSSGKM